MNHDVPVQSLIDHIKTATDVDPWAKEMAEELLKKQEPVKPQQKTIDGLLPHTFWWYECGNCRWDIEKDDMYCKHCGQAVKWDD